MVMASPTFQQVAGLAAKRAIEPASAISEPDDGQEDADMSPRPKGAMPPGPEREQMMVNLYQQGHTVKEIREAVGLSYDSAIYLALQKAGISPRNRYNTPNNGTATEDPTETVEVRTVEAAVPVNVVTAPVAIDLDMDVNVTPPPVEPEPEGVGRPVTYVLRVTIMRPVVESIEVDVRSFEEAVATARGLPGLVTILGVVRQDALQPHKDGDA